MTMNAFYCNKFSNETVKYKYIEIMIIIEENNIKLTITITHNISTSKIKILSLI